MRKILIAVGIALTVSIMLTPLLIGLFTRQGFGHEIRDDGPPSHKTQKRDAVDGRGSDSGGDLGGLPGHHLVGIVFDGGGPSASGLLVLGLATALGAVGFVDDLIKIRKARNLGLNKTAKAVGQVVAAVLFGMLLLQFRNSIGLTPGSAQLSYVREIATVTLAPAVFVLFCVVLVSAWSNAVNFTDGLDGLAAGLDGDGDRGIRDHHVLAVPKRVRDRPGARLLQRARPAGPVADRRVHRGCVCRFSVVERRAGENIHG